MVLLAAFPLSGKVISMVLAFGRCLKGVVSDEDESKLNLMVSSRPVVVVAAWVMVRDESSGRRNWESQPAPRTRKETSLGDEMEAGLSVRSVMTSVSGGQQERMQGT